MYAVFGLLILLISLAVIVLLILLDVWIAKRFAEFAAEKGYGKEYHVFALCFWLGLVGWLYVIAMPDRKKQ